MAIAISWLSYPTNKSLPKKLPLHFSGPCSPPWFAIAVVVTENIAEAAVPIPLTFCGTVTVIFTEYFYNKIRNNFRKNLVEKN